MTPPDSDIGPTLPELTWIRCPGDPQRDRLWTALLDARRRLAALMDAHERKDTVVRVCSECLRQADQEAEKAPYVAWDCLHQFDAEILDAMGDAERQARWCTLRAEAEEKLKGSWRNQAAANLIRRADDSKPVPVSLVRELHAHLAAAAQNQQHKLELFQRQSLRWLTVLLGTVIAVAAAFSCAVLTIDRLASLVPWARALALGIPAGALGGVLSTAFSLGRVDLKARIPDIRFSRLVTLTRPLLGATVAIPVLVFLQAGYVKVAGFDGSLSIAAFCFLAGFSERWFLGLMERFEGGRK